MNLSEEKSVIVEKRIDGQLSPGDIVGQFKIIKLLGHGGMGQVYLVENVQMHKKYALKILPEELSNDSQFISRFRVEARVMADLDHENIVKVHHMGEDNGRYFLVMDFIAGKDDNPYTLQDALHNAENKKLPEDQVKKIALQICDALEYAHSFGKDGVIHRDLKPSNILLQHSNIQYSTRNNQCSSKQKSPLERGARQGGVCSQVRATDHQLIKISDFGLAKILGADYLKNVIEKSVSLTMSVHQDLSQLETVAPGTADSYQKTTTGSILGTYEYMSPEQKNGINVSAQSDVFSFGIMIYQMLTGKKPEGRWKLPSKHGCSKFWDKIVEKTMEPDTSDRYSSISELKKDLKSATSGQRSVFGMRVLKVFSVLAVLCVLAVVGWKLNKQSRHSPDTYSTRNVQYSSVETHRSASNLVENISLDNSRKDSSFEGEDRRMLVGKGDFNSDEKTKDKTKISALKKSVFDLASITKEKINELKKLKLNTKETERSFNSGNDAKDSGEWQLAYEYFNKVTNEAVRVILKKEYNIAKQKFEERFNSADKQLLSEFCKNDFDKIKENVKKAELKSNSENAQLYITAHSKLISAISVANKLKTKKDYETLITKIGDCNHQKMWIEAEKLANQAINSGYKDVSKAKILLQEIKKHLPIEKGDKKTIDLGNGVKMEFVGIPKGNFKMGDIQAAGQIFEKPAHNINISKGFWMGKFEVTQKQFRQFVNATGYKTQAEKLGWAYIYDGSSWKKENGKCWENVFVGDDRPVVCVSWDEAKEFCKWLSDKTKLNVRLPTEAEWEYACRADSTTKYYSGNNASDLEKVGWYRGNSGKQTHPVGRKNPNDFGLYDMHGNVMEYCEDKWHSNYNAAPTDGSAWTTGNSSSRVLRGGSWYDDVKYCRVTNRCRNSPKFTYDCSSGFRVVLAFL